MQGEGFKFFLSVPLSADLLNLLSSVCRVDTATGQQVAIKVIDLEDV
jgi:hypothetical protein